MLRRMRAGVLAVLAMLAATATEAAEPAQTTATYGEWTVRCVAREALPPCDMLQVAVAQDSGRQVLRLSLAHLGEDRIGVQAWVPLGVMVSAGAMVRADGKRVELPGFGFTRCEGSGCFIEAIVPEASLAPFKRGREGVVAMLDSAGNPRGTRLGFSGFTAALEAMKTRNLAWWAERGQRGDDR